MRRAHRFFGLLAVLPLLAWIGSGVAMLALEVGPDGPREVALPTEPLKWPVTVRPEPGVTEVRVFATSLGQHLIQRTEFGWRHLDPATGQLKPVPNESELRRLLEAAFATDAEGFGKIEVVTADSTVTSTGRVVALDWPSFSASYHDDRTELAGWLRRIHGLGLSGIPAVDRWVSIVAGALALLLGCLGLALLATEEGGTPARESRRRR